MSILFVLLTFLLVLTVMYFRRPQEELAEVQVAPARQTPPPMMLKPAGFEAPQGYCFHPGHTWVVDEGRQNGRVGLDAFAANLLGQVDSIEIAELNRWIRQGQPLCTLTRAGQSIDLLSPVEGVVVSRNHALLKNPNLAVEDPYVDGWLCLIKAPEMSINLRNLLQGPLTDSWMQNSLTRLGALMQQLNPALAQDGGLPVKGLLFQLDATTRQQLAKEFFLS